MPETLQKLHESSKTLETNQTAISQKIFEVQQRIETVEKEVNSQLNCHVNYQCVLMHYCFSLHSVFTVERQHP